MSHLVLHTQHVMYTTLYVVYTLFLGGVSKQERTEKTAYLFHYMDLILHISFDPESVSLLSADWFNGDLLSQVWNPHSYRYSKGIYGWQASLCAHGKNNTINRSAVEAFNLS